MENIFGPLSLFSGKPKKNQFEGAMVGVDPNFPVSVSPQTVIDLNNSKRAKPPSAPVPAPASTQSNLGYTANSDNDILQSLNELMSKSQSQGSAGSDTTTRTTTESKILPAGVLDELKEAYKALAKAQGDTLQAEATGAQKQAELYQEQSNLDEQATLDAKKQQEAYQKQRTEEIQRLSDVQNKYIDGSIDPHRAWNNKSGFSQAMAILGAAMSGFGMARVGQAGRNPVLDALNVEVEQDIRVQEFNINQAKGDKRDAVSAQLQRMGLQREDFQDSQAAANAQRLLKYQSIDTALKGVASTTQSQVALSKIGELQKGVDLKIHEISLNMLTETKKVEKIEGGGGGQGKPVDPIKQIKDMQDIRKMNRDEQEHQNARLVPGRGVALTPADATEAKDVIAKNKSFNVDIDELIKIREDYGVEVWNRDIAKRAMQLAADLRVNYKDLAKLGVLSATDYSLLDSIIPEDPSQIGYVLEQLKGAKKIIDEKSEAYFESRGLQKPEIPKSVVFNKSG